MVQPYTGAKELESILLARFPCGTHPCIDPIFGATFGADYWSDTTNATSPSLARDVDFYTGDVSSTDKNLNGYVRAVRGGS